jgi:serine/threonine-protein kinase
MSAANWTTRLQAAAVDDDATVALPPAAPAAKASLVGSRIGPYLVTKRLGVGGVGEVFKAADVMLKRDVAIKVLRQELAADPQFLERFRREAQLHAKLSHPNVASVHAFLHEGSAQFLVMEFVPGVALDEFIRSGGPVPVARALGIFRRVLDAIEHAHAAGIVHRDIKPANIMLADSGQVKVMDFGIARALDCQEQLTRHGHVAGTARSMAPEQIRGRPADVRSDIYSLGIVLYTLLAGRAPFDADTDFALMKAQLEQMPPPLAGAVPGVPAAVEAAVLRALQKDPAARFQTVAEFAQALDDCAVPVVPAGPPPAAAAAAERATALLDEPTTSRTVINPVLLGAQRLPPSGAAPAPQRRLALRLSARQLQIASAVAGMLALGAAGAWLATRGGPEGAPVPSKIVAASGTVDAAPAEPSAADATVTDAPRAQPPLVEPPAAALPPQPAPPAAPATRPASSSAAPRTLSILRLSADGRVDERGAAAAQRFQPGERIRLRIAPSHDAHVYCYLQDEAKRIVRFYPNRFSPSAQVSAAAPLDLPGAMRFEMVANRQRINETVMCFASEHALEAVLPKSAFGTDFAALPVSSLDQLARTFARAGGGTLVEARWRVAFR